MDTSHLESIKVLVRIRPEIVSTLYSSHQTPSHVHAQLLSPSESLSLPFTPSRSTTTVNQGGQSCITDHNDGCTLSIIGLGGSLSSSSLSSAYPNTPSRTPRKGLNTPPPHPPRTPSTAIKNVSHKFEFDAVFGKDSTQGQVFEQIQPLVVDSTNGFHTTIFAYGCTGSGKTHTIMGDIDTPENIDCLADSPESGIIPRAVDLLFKILSESSKTSMVFVTYVELHNNTFYDLLAKDNSNKIDIRESSADDGKGVYLSGVERKQVTSTDEVHNHVREGNKIRATATTNLNQRSSRSHALLTLEIETIAPSSATSVKMGKLNIVDLAGSERVQLSGVVGDALAEASAINASLSALGDVLNALSKFHKNNPNPSSTPSRKQPFVPFRNSKLTHILKDSLGGSCKTVMIATIRPGELFYGQTLSTLRYASRARDIKNAPTMHSESSSRGNPGTPSGNASALAQAYSTINQLHNQLNSRISEFDSLKSQPSSPDAQRKIRSLRRKHAAEVIELKRQMSGVVQNNNSELEVARCTAEKLTSEMEQYKAEADKKIEQMKEQTQQLVEEAKHTLDDDARKTLKKLAKERKQLKEKNSLLENEVSSMRRELKEISVKNKNNSQNTSMMVGDLHLQLQTLRHGLEKAVGQEDAVKEKEGWKARCMEAVEHLERLKHEAEARKKKQRLLEASMSRLREEKEEFVLLANTANSQSTQHSAALSKEIQDLSAENHRLRQKYQSSKDSFLELQSKLKESELKNDKVLRDVKHMASAVSDLEEQREQREYQFEQQKKRMHEARMEGVAEKSAVEGRNEYLERENIRFKSECVEENKKREYAERESARNVPLQSRVSKLSEENEMIKNDNDNLRARVRRYEADSKHNATVEMERDSIRKERDKLSVMEGAMKAELHQLRKQFVSATEEQSMLRNELKVAKDLNEDLDSALQKEKHTNMEMGSRIDEVGRDNKDLTLDLSRTKNLNDKLREDQEALGALCSSLKKTLDHLEKEKDSDSAKYYSANERRKEDERRALQKIGDLEGQLSKMTTKHDTQVHVNHELQDSVSLHRGKSSTLTGELSVLQENLTRTSADLKAQNERRLNAEEKLSAEQRATERLLRENEKLQGKISQLNGELNTMRGARDGDASASKMAVGAANAAAEREKLSREAAEHREEELVRRVSLVQASLTQEAGARKGAQAARDAAVMESDTMKVRLDEAQTSLKIFKNEKIEFEKLIMGLKDDNHKARGGVLALTMEIESIREKMGDTKEKLEVENEGMKGKLGRSDAERQQLFIDNDELRRLIATKTNDFSTAKAQIASLEEQLVTAKNNTASHVKTGIQAVHDARDHGFEEGCEHAKAEMRETVAKMQSEVKEMVEEIIQSQRDREAVQEELAEHDAAFKFELDKLHSQLDSRADEVLKLKAIIGEKDTEMREEVRGKALVEKQLKIIQNKYEYEHRSKDEIVHQAHDEVESLRKRTMSLEKDLARTDKSKKEWQREARHATKQSKNDMKKALGIVKSHVAAGAPEELALDLEQLLGVEEEETSLSESDISSMGGVSTPGSISVGTPGSTRSRKASLQFGTLSPIGFDKEGGGDKKGVSFKGMTEV